MFWVADEAEQVTTENDAATATASKLQAESDQLKNIQNDQIGGHFENQRWSMFYFPLRFVSRMWQKASADGSTINLQSKLSGAEESSKHWATAVQKASTNTNGNSWISGNQTSNKVVPLACSAKASMLLTYDRMSSHHKLIPSSWSSAEWSFGSSRVPLGNAWAIWIRERHLELEPLCCISSCLVRGGCTAVAAFEYGYVVFTVLAIILRLRDDGQFSFWSPFKMTYDSLATHTVLLYILLGYDLVTIAMATALLRALITFDKKLARIHLYFDYFALAINMLTSILFISALVVEHSEVRTFANILLTVCFVSHIPLQIWAITVVRSCLEFFILVHVFVEMAEK